MSLDWNATAVKDFDNLTEEDHVTKEALIWASIPVGMSEITEANAREFFTRVSFDERIGGAKRVEGDGTPKFFDFAEVERFIGLRTNASRFTKAQFLKRQMEFHERWNVRF